MFPVLTHPSDLACGYANHQGVRLDVPVDHCPGAYECKFADGGPADDSAVGSQSGAALDQGIAEFIFALDQ